MEVASRGNIARSWVFLECGKSQPVSLCCAHAGTQFQKIPGALSHGSWVLIDASLLGKHLCLYCKSRNSTVRTSFGPHISLDFTLSFPSFCLSPVAANIGFKSSLYVRSLCLTLDCLDSGSWEQVCFLTKLY